MHSLNSTDSRGVSGLSRRAALKHGLAGILTCAVAPGFLRAALAGNAAPNNRLNVALIGNGLICGSHYNALIGRDDCRIVAVCDVARGKAEKLAERIIKHYSGAKETSGAPAVGVYQYFEEVLARPDIDAVFVCTPDHWHAPISCAAMRAGKDVYCEKPLTLTVREGRTLVRTARQYGRVLQTGTQQRSEATFRRAAEIVRNGLLGEIKRIRTRLGEFPLPPELPEQPVPADFDYDRWLGPTPWRPYHEKRVLGLYSGGWRCFTEYGGRKNGDWGAHHFDIIQWALGKDDSGPVEFIPKGYQGELYQTHVYANGLRVERYEDGMKHMIEFTGSEGTLGVSRNNLLDVDPAVLARRPTRPSEMHLYVSDNHHTDFLNAVRTRQRTISDVETGHRSATIGHLCNIAAQLGRPLKWNPATEEIANDPVATAMLDRPRRAPYGTL
ncbi:MAG: Gfo/Idh/MocA family oxidoreductase [Opitutae bacterium]|nr:Gfo/Idh/MocA family oxidoreductase [Opitutae bacterium]